MLTIKQAFELLGKSNFVPATEQDRGQTGLCEATLVADHFSIEPDGDGWEGCFCDVRIVVTGAGIWFICLSSDGEPCNLVLRPCGLHETIAEFVEEE